MGKVNSQAHGSATILLSSLAPNNAVGFIICFGVTLQLVLFRYTGIVLRNISVKLESELNLVLHQRSAQSISASLFRMHHQVTPTPFRHIMRCCAGAHCTSTAHLRITSILVFTSNTAVPLCRELLAIPQPRVCTEFSPITTLQASISFKSAQDLPIPQDSALTIPFSFPVKFHHALLTASLFTQEDSISIKGKRTLLKEPSDRVSISKKGVHVFPASAQLHWCSTHS